jgi:hypothetical protein
MFLFDNQVFVGSSEPDPNSLWKIQFDKELATYSDTSIRLLHIKSNQYLGICYQGYHYDNSRGRGIYCYHKSPLTKHTEGNNKLKDNLFYNRN